MSSLYRTRDAPITDVSDVGYMTGSRRRPITDISQLILPPIYYSPQCTQKSAGFPRGLAIIGKPTGPQRSTQCHLPVRSQTYNAPARLLADRVLNADRRAGACERSRLCATGDADKGAVLHRSPARERVRYTVYSHVSVGVSQP